ncbi:MAG TPA: TlyA family RNA methyltransferase [Terriglobia bacterium]|nr:TlyA family RNA methyltransferase [Terriglobia bacterium]
MDHHRQKKIRLDRLLVERGLTDSRQKAQAMILAGQVMVDEQKVEKCGTTVSAEAGLRILGETLRYVGRAGVKLEAALDHFGIDPKGKACLDIGASTGGFTDCLLQRGAARVFAVDAGTNQLDWKLRHDARVRVMEKTNARYLGFDQIGALVALVTMDVSFISSTLILPVLPPLLEERSDLLVLVKPQFEVGRDQVGKGGVVRDLKLHQEAVAKVSLKAADLGFIGIGRVESVLPGVAGNREFFLHAIWPKNV